MKKYLSKILVSAIIVAIFLAPVSAGIKINDKQQLALGVEINEALAVNITDLFSGSSISNVTANSNSVNFTAQVVLNQQYSDQIGGTDPNTKNTLMYYKYVAGDSGHPEQGIYFVIQNTTNPNEKEKDLYWTSFPSTVKFDITKTNNIISGNSGAILTPGTAYTIKLKINADPKRVDKIFGGAGDNFSWESSEKQFTTTTTGTTGSTNAYASGSTSSSGEGTQSFACSLVAPTNIGGCIAQVFYALWVASSWVAQLAGNFLDFFVYYATNSSSYSNDFVKQGWAAVRDVANIFFIIALLYVAIKTILGLNVTDNKKLIGAVVVIALIINFSLFATEVVIDGSNILAKVFYNNITSKDANAPKNADGTLQNSAVGAGGQKSISVGLIDKFNPQTIAMTVYQQMPIGYFIFVTLLLIAITLYTAYIFFSVALLFVARVVSLWIYMIFSPLAFASYTVPFDIPGFGHKEWWTNVIKNAFLAPLFIFFLYIIVLFAGFLDKIITYTDNQNLTNYANIMQHLMSVVIPFVIIFMLLKMAKKLAVDYSGELGASINKFGATVGGAVVGRGIGATAVLGRMSIGRVGSAIANSEWAKEREKNGKFASTLIMSGAKSIGSGSFDVRGIKVGGKTLAGATGLSLGEAQKGGFTERKRTQIEKRQKRAEELEVGEDETLKQKLNTAEDNLQSLLIDNSHSLEILDKRIDTWRKKQTDASTRQRVLKSLGDQATPEQKEELETANKEAVEASNNVRELNVHRSAIKNGKDYKPTTEITAINKEDIGKTQEYSKTATIKINEINPETGIEEEKQKSINDFEDYIIPEIHHEIEHKNRERKRGYATSGQTGWERTKGFVSSGGTYTYNASRETAHKIRMEAKLDSGKKEGGH